jgi:hypothetical protein
MCHRTLLSLLAALLLSACAAAMPGYTPESKHKPKLAAPDPGTMTPEGTYQLSETENKFDCWRGHPRRLASGRIVPMPPMLVGASELGEVISSYNMEGA